MIEFSAPRDPAVHFNMNSGPSMKQSPLITAFFPLPLISLLNLTIFILLQCAFISNEKIKKKFVLRCENFH